MRRIASVLKVGVSYESKMAKCVASYLQNKKRGNRAERQVNDRTSSRTDNDSSTDLLINTPQNLNNISSGDLGNQKPLRIKAAVLNCQSLAGKKLYLVILLFVMIWM